MQPPLYSEHSFRHLITDHMHSRLTGKTIDQALGGLEN